MVQTLVRGRLPSPLSIYSTHPGPNCAFISEGEERRAKTQPQSAVFLCAYTFTRPSHISSHLVALLYASTLASLFSIGRHCLLAALHLAFNHILLRRRRHLLTTRSERRLTKKIRTASRAIVDFFPNFNLPCVLIVGDIELPHWRKTAIWAGFTCNIWRVSRQVFHCYAQFPPCYHFNSGSRAATPTTTNDRRAAAVQGVTLRICNYLGDIGLLQCSKSPIMSIKLKESFAFYQPLPFEPF